MRKIRMAGPAGGLMLLVAPMATAAQQSTDAASNAKPASAYVRCDGFPDNMTTGETVARLVAITAVVGLLAPPPEAADPSKRQSGQLGIDACNELLTGDKVEDNAERRTQLLHGRAIHRIEVRDFDGAIADLHLASAEQPLLAATTAFKLGLGLSASDIEAMALVGKGQLAEAKRVALAMAAAAPYDLVTLLRARAYVNLTDSFGPPEQAYWAALVRVYPDGLGSRAEARAGVGDFQGAARDIDEQVALIGSIKELRVPIGRARSGLYHAFAGNLEEARTRIAKAREESEAMRSAGEDANVVTSTTELLDFYAIWELARQGQMKAARLQFAGRSRWAEVHPALLDRMAADLRKAAAADDLIGSLAKPDGSFVVEAAQLRAKLVADGGKDGKARFNAMRAPLSDGEFSAFAGNIWRDGPSKYLAKKPSADWQATVVNVQRNGMGVPAGYALLLDSARTARKLGKERFQLMPGRIRTYAHFVRFGNAGEPGITSEASYDALQVESDLAPLFPKPARRTAP